MKELFRERDYTRVGYYQSVLESEGIPTFVRNQDLVTMTTEVPIPDMFPALCVMNERDYERAVAILRELVSTSDEATTDDSVTGVFVVGIVLIFGGFALGQIVQIMSQLVFDNATAYWDLMMRGAFALAAIWIVWITAKRWRPGQDGISENP